MSSFAASSQAKPRYLVVSEHSSKRYSGGRYHSWIMSEALCAGGAAVDVWTNEDPLLARDFESYGSHREIQVRLDPEFASIPNEAYDAVLLVPHLRLDWSAFVGAVRVALRRNCPLVFLDFESPKWFNEINSTKRPWYRTLSWWWTARFADVILSSTLYGSSKAQEYYRPARPREAFLHCYPAINSVIADQVIADQVSERDKTQVICIARLDHSSRHKGVDRLKAIIGPHMKGHRLLVIGGMPEAVAAELSSVSREHGVDFKVISSITDVEKFSEIVNSKLMIFLSNFEGFGYPPLEAVYCNIPCVLSDLPTVREVAEDSVNYAADLQTASRMVAEMLEGKNLGLPKVARERVMERVGFEDYAARMTKLLADFRCAPDRQVAARLRKREAWLFLAIGAILKFVHGLLRVASSRAGAR